MPEYAPLEAILRLCAAAAPVPWYPKAAAADLGLTDEDLAAFVEQLRGGGLIARTDAAPGHGRGYVLTPAGVQALRDPGDLEWLRRGEVPPRKAPAAEPAPADAVPQRERAVRMSLLAPFTAYITYGLVAVNVAVFLWGVYLGRRQGIPLEAFVRVTPPDIAYATGALRPADVMPPGWGLVRLLTCCFVHFGLIHLAVNMISLHLVGPLLERMWGHVRFLVIYLVAGFGGSCAAMVLKPGGGAAELAGASGALWGILGSMAVWVLLNRRYMPRRLLSSWGVQIVIALVINVAITYMVPGVSAEAHYGGGATGAVCAVLVHLTRFGPSAVRIVAAAAVAALPVFGVWAVTHPARFNTQWETVEMEQRMVPRVSELEQEALKFAPGAAADPLIENRGAERRDPEQVKKSIEGYGQAEAVLRPAADLLRQAGPYRDPATEKARQVRLELVEARLDLFARNKRCLEAGKDWSRPDEEERQEAVERFQMAEQPAPSTPQAERRMMEQFVMPRVRKREEAAMKLARDAVADLLIKQDPAGRDEDRVRKAIDAYGDAEAALGPAAHLLRRAGPYGDPETEKARQVRLGLVEARLDLFARNKRCLEAGKQWSRQDEDAREEAIERVRQLEKEWGKLLQ
jgi:membrane associated rhomboid family serine protease